MPADVIAHALAHNVELWPWEPPADYDDAPKPEPPALPQGSWFAQHLREDS